jgi:hypothetical protein
MTTIGIFTWADAPAAVVVAAARAKASSGVRPLRGNNGIGDSLRKQ